MAQHRDAPAFQEYAASMMARTDYRVMGLEARGLLYTLRLECWVNGKMPGAPHVLARALGRPQDEIERALPEVMPFFRIEGGEIRCPELDDYRAHIEDRRQRQSAGGRAGAAVTNGTRRQPPSGSLSGRPRVGRESLVKPSPVKPSPTQGNQGEASDDPWVNDYERGSRGE